MAKKAGGVGALIRTLREARSLSLSQLAKKAGTTKMRLHRLERGKVRLRHEDVAPLARALGVPVSRFYAEAA